MEPQDRVRKPEPERTRPIRNWWTAFGPPGPPPPTGAPPAAGAAPPDDPVSRGVEMGYRVVEEYLRQGQQVARMMWAPYAAGGGETPPAGPPPYQHLDAMFRSFSDFAGLWMDMMGRMSRGGFAPPAPQTTPASGAAGPFAMGGAAPPPEAVAHEATSLTLEVHAAGRTEVTLDLRPGATGQPLRVLVLRAPEPDAPRLTDVSLEWAPGEPRLRVRLQVPDGHPPGVYSGVILDPRTSLPRGVLSVRLLPP